MVPRDEFSVSAEPSAGTKLGDAKVTTKNFSYCFRCDSVHSALASGQESVRDFPQISTDLQRRRMRRPYSRAIAPESQIACLGSEAAQGFDSAIDSTRRKFNPKRDVSAEIVWPSFERIDIYNDSICAEARAAHDTGRRSFIQSNQPLRNPACSLVEFRLG